MFRSLKYCFLICILFHSHNVMQANTFAIQEVEKTQEFYPVKTPRTEGYLKVSDLHSIYYATYGNPDGVPVVVLHGGPGAGCSDGLTSFFDLDYWHVVMFDQRGAMRSTPLAEMTENSPQHSISDIEALRQHLGIDKWLVFGGSWGSTLSVLYGQAHPENCLGFVLRGVFQARERDYMHLFYDMGRIFPEAYDEFIKHIPESERQNILAYSYEKIMDPNPEVHMPLARAFMKFDLICATHLPNPAVANGAYDDNSVLSITRAYAYYAYNKFFLEPNQIINNMDKIGHLPSIIVHGRWDAICLPENAYTLHKNWPNSSLWMIPDGGHSAADPAISRGLLQATEAFKKQFTLEKN